MKSRRAALRQMPTPGHSCIYHRLINYSTMEHGGVPSCTQSLRGHSVGQILEKQWPVCQSVPLKFPQVETVASVKIESWGSDGIVVHIYTQEAEAGGSQTRVPT